MRFFFCLKGNTEGRGRGTVRVDGEADTGGIEMFLVTPWAAIVYV